MKTRIYDDGRQITVLDDEGDNTLRGYHVILHGFPGFVTAQIFDSDGRHVSAPGHVRAWRQDAGRVLIPVLHNGGADRSLYPATVVIR